MKGLFRIVDMKRWYLCPQVRVADIVQLNGNIRPRSRQWWQLFRMVSQWHVDVVIVERRSFSIVAAVELDDASHLRPERRRRDILLEEVLRQAGIPLLRSHDARKLLQMTGEWLNNTTGADQQSRNIVADAFALLSCPTRKREKASFPRSRRFHN